MDVVRVLILTLVTFPSLHSVLDDGAQDTTTDKVIKIRFCKIIAQKGEGGGGGKREGDGGKREGEGRREGRGGGRGGEEGGGGREGEVSTTTCKYVSNYKAEVIKTLNF